MSGMKIPAHPIKDVREPISVKLTCNSRIRKWAFENAYTLIVMMVLFGITWLWIFLSGVRHIAG